MKIRLLTVSALSLLCFAARPSLAQPNSALLNSVLWMQKSEEHNALTLMAYRTAERTLDEALRTKRWTAVTEQSRSYDELPPAVILDIDETVLDNSPFEARLIREDQPFSSQAWNAWVNEAGAGAIPGALPFVRLAASKGIKIFYITNRDKDEEEATRKNLTALGFPLDTNVDTVLTLGEREGWTSDKSSRRLEVAHRYRVLILIGDNLNDFISAGRSGHRGTRCAWRAIQPLLGEPVDHSPQPGLWKLAGCHPG